MSSNPPGPTPENPTPESVLRICDSHGIPASDYLKAHIKRFLTTHSLVSEQWSPGDGRRVLDIGAHWLHNAICYALSGFEVTASDLAINDTLTNPAVQAMAADHGIRLKPYRDLSDPVELESLPMDSFDLILFTEILEHITFNPVRMWSVLYRLLRPGGRIIVTTPNYHVAAFLDDAKSLLRGRSSGIQIDRLLETNTYGPHWKEYAGGDIREYFQRLSPDFRVNRLLFTDPYPPAPEEQSGFISRIRRELAEALPDKPELTRALADHLIGMDEVRCFKRSLHAEIDLVGKAHGIVVKPHW